MEIISTKILKIENPIIDKANVNKASEILHSGGIVAIPTETVYGLAVNAFNESAIKKVFEAKGRPSDNPLIVHIHKLKQLRELVNELPEIAKTLMKAFWPGALTIILPKSSKVPDITTAGLDTIAVRMPSNKITLAILKKCGFPLAAPSANLSGSPSPTRFEHVLSDLNGKIDAIVQSSFSKLGVESTVVLPTENSIRILRPGTVTVEQLRQTVDNVIIDKTTNTMTCNDDKILSPGTKYKHYAPKIKLCLVSSSSQQFADFVNLESENNDCVALVFDDEQEFVKCKKINYGHSQNFAEQAHNLFSALRKADESNAAIIYAHAPNQQSEGLAVYNRLLRASGFNVKTL